LAEAADHIKAMGDTMAGWALASAENAPEIYKVGQNTARFLMALGDLVLGWLLLRQAQVGDAALAEGPTAAAHDTRQVAGQSFFAKTELPRLAAVRRILVDADLDLPPVPEDAFCPGRAAGARPRRAPAAASVTFRGARTAVGARPRRSGPAEGSEADPREA